MACPGSVKAQDAAGRPPAGEAAINGTRLHADAERHLREGTKCTDPLIKPYVDAVRRAGARADVTPQIEVRLDLSRFHRELYGTADALIIDLAWGVLTIFDFKSGFHHVAADALQLRLYAAMSYLSLPAADQHKIKWIDTCVVQPNSSGEPIRRVRHTVADIINTLSDYVDIAHVATDDIDPPRTAGSWCRNHFCAARSSCPAFRAMTVREAQAEFTSIEIGGERSEN